MKKISFLLSILLTTQLSYSQIVIGNTGAGDPVPDVSGSTILDIQANDKGILIPRVTLTSNIDTTTIPITANDNGMIVYNDGTNPNFAGAGYFFWNGDEWRRLNESTSAQPEILALKCNNASLYPPNYIAGTAYTGTLTVPYTGGNGGKYDGGNGGTTSNGLTYVLQNGRLTYGTGNLVYNVSGTPTSTSPTTTDFNINFLDKSCTTTQGTGNVIDNLTYVRKTVSPLVAGTAAGSTASDSEVEIGSLKVRYYVVDVNQGGYLQVATTNPIVTHASWIYHKAGTGSAGLENYGQIPRLPRVAVPQFNIPALTVGTTWPTNTWSDLIDYKAVQGTTQGENYHSGFRDLGYIIISLHNTDEVYRVTVNTNVAIPANGNVPAAASGATLFVEKLGVKPE